MGKSSTINLKKIKVRNNNKKCWCYLKSQSDQPCWLAQVWGFLGHGKVSSKTQTAPGKEGNWHQSSDSNRCKEVRISINGVYNLENNPLQSSFETSQLTEEWCSVKNGFPALYKIFLAFAPSHINVATSYFRSNTFFKISS